MKNIKNVLVVICVFLIAISIISCSKKCTDKYCAIMVSVKYTDNSPVFLDKYYVKKVSTGEIIDYSIEESTFDSIGKLKGNYVLFADGEMDMTLKKGTKFEFVGEIDSIEIIREEYLIGNDGCHIEVISGDTEIIVQSE